MKRKSQQPELNNWLGMEKRMTRVEIAVYAISAYLYVPELYHASIFILNWVGLI